jgi:DNA-binding NtrC family response regulator
MRRTTTHARTPVVAFDPEGRLAERILIVDDDPVQRRILQGAIERFGFKTETAATGDEALSALQGADADEIALVVLDLVMPELDGMGTLERMRKDGIYRPVIVQTAHGGIDTVVGAVRAGAIDFFVKPVSPERLEVSIRNALKVNALEDEIARIKRRVDGTLTFADIVTRASAMQRVIGLGERAAGSNIPIILEGESGVGKELIARAIQGSSARAGKPFVAVNCGAIPENLVESTLFGHEKGAFTGATDKRIGKFVEADGGTLFLDEVGELPPEAQVKLLRALQEGEVDPVGARRPVKTDFRLISATNRSMIDLVREGRFREDLYYRLNVFPIVVPPLRARPEDVAFLVSHFITRFSAEEGKRIDTITPEALILLQRHRWPGNVRQLENAVFRAVVLADGPVLDVDHFPQIAAQIDDFSEAEYRPAFEAQAAIAVVSTASTHDRPLSWVEPVDPMSTGDGVQGAVPILSEAGEVRPLEEIEADLIRFAVDHYNGRMSEVARRLGIGRSTLYRRLKELNLDPAE